MAEIIKTREEAMVNKLIQKTVTNEIRWKVETNIDARSDFELHSNFVSIAGSVYSTTIFAASNSNSFRLYKFNYEWFYEDDRHLDQDIQLEMFDTYTKKTMYVVPAMRQFVDLYNAVSKQASGIAGFMDRFLAE